MFAYMELKCYECTIFVVQTHFLRKDNILQCLQPLFNGFSQPSINWYNIVDNSNMTRVYSPWQLPKRRVLSSRDYIFILFVFGKNLADIKIY